MPALPRSLAAVAPVLLGRALPGLAQAKGSPDAGLTAAPAADAAPAPAVQTGPLGHFSKVHVAGAVDLVLHGGAAAHSAEVDCPTKSGPGVQLQVQGQTLMITPQHEGRRTGGCQVTLGAPVIAGVQISGAADVDGDGLVGLERVEVAGAGDLDLRGIDSPALALELAGAGDATLAGAVDRLTVGIAGAGDVDAKALSARAATLRISGAGDIDATVTESLDASTAGAGDIDVWGSPPQVQRPSRGIGRVSLR